MKSISTKESHEKTGSSMREVAEEHAQVVTERGTQAEPVPPLAPIAAEKLYLGRRLLPGVAELIDRPMIGPDSALIVSEMRDGR